MYVHMYVLMCMTYLILETIVGIFLRKIFDFNRLSFNKYNFRYVTSILPDIIKTTENLLYLTRVVLFPGYYYEFFGRVYIIHM